MGLSPHSDAVGLTVLLQVNEVQGLQIKNNDAWVPVKPLPDAFIISIADINEVKSCTLKISNICVHLLITASDY